MSSVSHFLLDCEDVPIDYFLQYLGPGMTAFVLGCPSLLVQRVGKRSGVGALT